MVNLSALRRALAELTPYGALLEVAMLAASLGIAYALVWALRGKRKSEAHSIWFGERLYDGVLFPLAALLAGMVLQGRCRT
jgi:multidrug transporter EmrE-like cation transporter